MDAYKKDTGWRRGVLVCFAVLLAVSLAGCTPTAVTSASQASSVPPAQSAGAGSLPGSVLSAAPTVAYTQEELESYVLYQMMVPENYSAEQGLEVADVNVFWLVCDTHCYLQRIGQPMELYDYDGDGTPDEGWDVVPAADVAKMAEWQYGDPHFDVTQLWGQDTWYDEAVDGFRHACAHGGKGSIGFANTLRSSREVGDGNIEVIIDYYSYENVPEEHWDDPAYWTWLDAQRCVVRPMDLSGEVIFTLLFSEPTGQANAPA